MSEQIHINASGLETEIEALKSMQSRWSAMNTTPPAAVGGGATVNELELIGSTYHNLHSAMLQLIGNTIGFMENTLKSYQHSDNTAAHTMEKK